MRITDIGGKVVNIEGHDTRSDDYPHPLEGITVIMVTRYDCWCHHILIISTELCQCKFEIEFTTVKLNGTFCFFGFTKLLLVESESFVYLDLCCI
jgi:hypothetical protein